MGKGPRPGALANVPAKQTPPAVEGAALELWRTCERLEADYLKARRLADALSDPLSFDIAAGIVAKLLTHDHVCATAEATEESPDDTSVDLRRKLATARNQLTWARRREDKLRAEVQRLTAAVRTAFNDGREAERDEQIVQPKRTTPMRGRHRPQMEGDKRCTRCGEVKHITSFSANRYHRDGRQSHCKDCHARIYHRKPAGEENVA
jgi:hypothetical protein